MTIENGNTDLELGGEEEILTEEVPEGEQTGQEEELDEEILKEFDGATPQDLMRALKIYKDRAKRSDEKAELYRDLYGNLSVRYPETRQQRQTEQRDPEDLARRGDVEDVVANALQQDAARRRQETIRNEAMVFAQTHPDFHERVAAVTRFVREGGHRGLEQLIDEHPRPWEYVYKLAEDMELVKPTTVQKKTGVKSDIDRIKENAQKAKTLSGVKGSPVPKKSVKDMTEEEFEAYSAKLRDEL